jgi:hypothetical protein
MQVGERLNWLKAKVSDARARGFLGIPITITVYLSIEEAEDLLAYIDHLERRGSGK